jgi:hypothetical protein
MKRVFKYVVPGPPVIGSSYLAQIDLPIGAEVLSFQCQDGVPCIWALVDDEAEPEPRVFVFAGTGHPLFDLPLDYVGTAQNGRGLVWHLFERSLRPPAPPKPPAKGSR